jgi:hypothetical protein
MGQLISEIWVGLRDAGLPEVMLYLPDNSACRCHWDDTELVGQTRVALLADQDRQIVRIFPVDACVGIGIASPKGIDPSGYRRFVQKKLKQANDEIVEEDAPEESAAPCPAPTLPTAASPVLAPSPAAPPEAVVEPPPTVDPLVSRWGVAMKPAGRFGTSGLARH